MPAKKGAKRGYDWAAIMVRYATGRESLAAIAKAENIPVPTIQQRATKEHWGRLRERHRAKIVEKTSEKMAAKVARALARDFTVAEKLTNVLKTALADDLQFRRYIISEGFSTSEKIFEKVDMKSLGNAVKALKDLTEIKQIIKNDGVQTAQTEENTGGVVILPEVEE